jgi:uncharacterized protein with PQ loop repeat
MSLIVDALGWIGSAAFSVCAIPQAYEALKQKACYINKSFINLWFIGEVFTLIYAISIGAAPLIVNYIVNGVCLLVIMYYNKPIKSDV